MLNLADFMALVITLAGAMGGLVGALEKKAGVVASILFGLGGLLIGLGAAFLSSKLAYSALLSKGAGILYMVIPPLFLFAVIAGTTFFSLWLARLIL